MRIQMNIFDIIINILCLVLLLGTVVYLAIVWRHLPDQIPAHFDFAGNVTRYGGKGNIIMLVVVNWILYWMSTILQQFPQIWNFPVRLTAENTARLYRLAKDMMNIFKLVVVAIFTLMTIYTSLGQPLPSWALPAFMVLMFAPIVYFIVKMVQAK